MITSLSNARLKEIRKLRDRKFRTETGLAWVEGLRACGEAFIRSSSIQQVVYCPETLRGEFANVLLAEAEKSGLDVFPVSRSAFSSLSGKDNPSGIGLVIQQIFCGLDSVSLEKGDLWIVLDQIADPGNLGTIMRTLDACGGRGIILINQCTDPFDPTAIRASTGAVFHLDIVKTESPGFISWQKSTDVKLVGAVAVPGALDYHSYIYSDPILLMMGSEREGLHPDLARICDQTVFIPMVGHVDSLNLAEATAIVLYEIFNQHRTVKVKIGVQT